MNCHAPSWLEHLTQQGLQMVPGWIHSFPVGPGIEPAFRRGDSDALNLTQNTLYDRIAGTQPARLGNSVAPSGRRELSLALATKLGGTALARLWPRFAQCSRNMPSMARSSAGLISRECATVTE